MASTKIVKILHTDEEDKQYEGKTAKLVRHMPKHKLVEVEFDNGHIHYFPRSWVEFVEEDEDGI